MKLARLHKLAHTEPYWHVQLAVLLAVGLQLIINNKLVVGPKYLIAAFEILLILTLAIFGNTKHNFIQHSRRVLAILLIALISIANIISLFLVSKELLGGKQLSGKELITSAIAIYLTNIIIFGLWYWELDVGASSGETADANEMDFLFPQVASKDVIPNMEKWSPTFTDYLYVSMTNASAFSPTDTMPLTHRAKTLMGTQSIVSLITVALVAARAVNILS